MREELKSKTDTHVLFFSFHMESDVMVEKTDGILVSGTAYRESNRGPNDVQSRVTKDGTRYEREQNGMKDKISLANVTFCVIDLYFEEPKNIKKIFSNMYTQMLPLKRIDSGKYQLITPDKNNPIFVYQAGKLVQVELNTPIGQVITTRI